MTKAQILKLILALLAATVPVIVSMVPGLPPALVALLNVLASLKVGDMLLKHPAPEAK